MPGYLDDYAFFVDGLIALHRATGEARWLDERPTLLTESAARAVLGQSAGWLFLYLDRCTKSCSPAASSRPTASRPRAIRSRPPTCSIWPACDKPDHVAGRRTVHSNRRSDSWKSIPRPCHSWPSRWRLGWPKSPTQTPEAGKKPRGNKACCCSRRGFLPAIRRGQKTQTIRLWNVCRMKSGQRSYIPGAGYIRVLSVEPVDVSLNGCCIYWFRYVFTLTGSTERTRM